MADIKSSGFCPTFQNLKTPLWIPALCRMALGELAPDRSEY